MSDCNKRPHNDDEGGGSNGIASSVTSGMEANDAVDHSGSISSKRQRSSSHPEDDDNIRRRRRRTNSKFKMLETILFHPSSSLSSSIPKLTPGQPDCHIK